MPDLVRYAIWASIAMFLVTMLHPILVMGAVVIAMTLIAVFASAARHIPDWLRLPVHVILPMTSLLSEERFMVITKASLKPFPWTSHLTILAYGLDLRTRMFSSRRLCLSAPQPGARLEPISPCDIILPTHASDLWHETICRIKGYRTLLVHARADKLDFWSRYGFAKVPGRSSFLFSDYEYYEMAANFASSNNQITNAVDPYILIRAEGSWHAPGVLEASAIRTQVA